MVWGGAIDTTSAIVAAMALTHSAIEPLLKSAPTTVDEAVADARSM
jgi:hypothetical protein